MRSTFIGEAARLLVDPQLPGESLLGHLADHCADRNTPPYGAQFADKPFIGAQNNFYQGYAEG